MRRKDDTMRDTLLDCARLLADADGIGAVNIRSIAGKAGIATGTVYNYFSHKDELLLALTEEYWKQTLAEMRMAVTGDSFCGRLEQSFTFLRERVDSSAGALMRSLGSTRSPGRERMAAMQEALGMALVRQMEQDPDVRRDIWNEHFTKEKYAHFIVMNMTRLLRESRPDFPFFIEIVRRTIYLTP